MDLSNRVIPHQIASERLLVNRSACRRGCTADRLDLREGASASPGELAGRAKFATFSLVEARMDSPVRAAGNSLQLLTERA